MITRSFCFGIATLLWVTAAGAQQPVVNRSWDSVTILLKRGSGVAVTRKDQARFEGSTRRIDAGSITLLFPDTSELTIPVRDVSRVEWTGVRTRRVLLYGVPLGFLIGGTASLLIDNYGPHTDSKGRQTFYPGESFGMGGLFIGIPLGAIIAAALPVGPPLYDAGRNNRP